ncbi:HNH endonuclease [Phycicoccus sp. CSK15P-2]|uniref:HNH endonuclease signature motif containing protein n=1 Tax=Phycicoccus sp. CSK15P-2 TaxID=2807627 RepID=UPI001951FC5B|nr:HNH endonuclease signature motif containing protein [Phycicoccus sp. CSK15P-2]MBM6402814.1 HNH endonuclease [Phycicoccus sp. CSK15P-2]
MKAQQAVETAVASLDALVHDASEPRSQEEWLAVARDCQALVNRLTAVQDAAIARAASVEPVWCEDGTLGRVDRGPGRVALDAPDLVAPVLGASHHQAQRRVEQAVRLAAGRAPVPADGDDRPEPNGLTGLHIAMRTGRLDAHRAGVVADELLDAPAEVAETVVAALDPHLDTEPAAGLRRRTRALLARISPDLLRRRAQRARSEVELRRWVGEPGVDVWHGSFPSESSAQAWSAITQLARRYVTDGLCTGIDQARAKALTDLVLQQADVQVQVVLAVPAEAARPGAAPVVPTFPAAGSAPSHEGGVQDGDLVQVHGARPSEPLLVPAGWLAERVEEGGVARVVACDSATGARLDLDEALSTDGYRPGARLAALVRARDGGCRFPGCSVAARLCDLDHARPWPAGPTSAANLLCLCRRHHRVKQSPGWSLRLHTDARAEWRDPTGRTTTTRPLDALDALTLRPESDLDPGLGPEPDPPPRRAHPPELPSVLEEHLRYRLDHHEAMWRGARVLEITPRAPLPDAPPF